MDRYDEDSRREKFRFFIPFNRGLAIRTSGYKQKPILLYRKVNVIPFIN